MAPTIFAEKYFSRVLMDVKGYETVFVDRIRGRYWYGLVYDNVERDVFYCPDMVTQIYTNIDTSTIDHDLYQFIVHFSSGDLVVNINIIEKITQIPCPPQHVAPLPLIDYMFIMGVRCQEKDRGLKASTTFRNVHCVGRWGQRNILGLNHTTSFNRLVLQIIHILMTKQHTVCLNTVLWQHLIANFKRTQSAKYSHLVLVTHLCKHFLPDEVFSVYDRVFIFTEHITSACNSCPHTVWTPTVMTGDVPAGTSSEEQSEEDEEESAFWQQPPPSDTKTFMSSIWKGIKKIFNGQAKLRKKVDEKNERLERNEEDLRRSQSMGTSTSIDHSRRPR